MDHGEGDRGHRLDGELDRLFALPDRWLGRELLNLARVLRTSAPEYLGEAALSERRYQTSLVWNLVPEVAFRLGERSFAPGERCGFTTGLTGPELRDRVCAEIVSQPLLVALADRAHRGMNLYALLTARPERGNPVLFAVDRFQPADRARPDWAAQCIRRHFSAKGVDDVFEWDSSLREANVAESPEPPMMSMR